MVGTENIVRLEPITLVDIIEGLRKEGHLRVSQEILDIAVNKRAARIARNYHSLLTALSEYQIE